MTAIQMTAWEGNAGILPSHFTFFRGTKSQPG